MLEGLFVAQGLLNAKQVLSYRSSFFLQYGWCTRIIVQLPAVHQQLVAVKISDARSEATIACGVNCPNTIAKQYAAKYIHKTCLRIRYQYHERSVGCIEHNYARWCYRWLRDQRCYRRVILYRSNQYRRHWRLRVSCPGKRAV